MTIKVLIADDHPIVRNGLRELIERELDFEIVAEASDGSEAVALALASDIDLAILDIVMPRKTGLQAAAEITKGKPDVRVLILSVYDNDEYLLSAARAGAAGYVLKSLADTVIVSACRAVAAGGRFVCPSGLTPALENEIERARRGDRVRRDVLTPRELEVLKLVAEGYSSQAIADELVISPKTVEHHRSNMLKKLGASDRVELTRHAIRRGLIDP